MSSFWFRCDECNNNLNVAIDEPMEVALRFKPGLVPWMIPKTHPREQRRRCRSCGYVTVLVPLTQAPLTDHWRSSIVMK